MKKSNKNIGCWGFYGQRNVGDDLILRELLRHISLFADKANVFISGDKLETARLNSFGINTVSIGRNPYKFFLKTLGCDLVICGPGGLFPHKNTFKLVYWFFLSMITRLRGSKIIFLGIGIGCGNFESFIDRLLMRGVLFFSNSFVTRQNGVKEVLHSRNKKLIEGADVLFTLDTNKKIYNVASKTAIIVLANIFDSTPNEAIVFVESFAPLVETLIKKWGFQVKLLTFTEKKDDNLNRLLTEQLNKDVLKNVKMIPFQEDPDINLQEISRADICIAMRFHALVISSIFNIPCCTIAYSDKMDDVAKRLGLSDYIVHICVNKREYYGKYIPLDANELTNKVILLMKNKEDVKNMLETNVPKMRNQGEISWLKLKEIIELL